MSVNLHTLNKCDVIGTIPVRQWLGGRRRQPNCRAAADEGDVKPEGEAVDVAGLKHVEFERDFDSVQLSFMNLLEIENVALRLGEANANVERVHLENIFIHSSYGGILTESSLNLQLAA